MIPKGGRLKTTLSFIPLETGELSVTGVYIKQNNYSTQILVDEKGYPLKILDEINIYKYEKLGINLRKINIKAKIPEIGFNFTKPDNQTTPLRILQGQDLELGFNIKNENTQSIDS